MCLATEKFNIFRPVANKGSKYSQLFLNLSLFKKKSGLV